ncbi:MAG: hypothetical protein DHS20C18_05620 [Saprospiraceae bacterium]|nr:MAG: hypothetical protein DHS20C18_05620 [Saprospiraceae bacterium]
MSAENKHAQAEAIVKNHVLISMGAGLVPIPLLDIAAVTAAQMDMVKQLSWLYNVDYPSNFDKSLITALTGSIFARIGASFIKIIPGVGSLLGGLSMALMSGASTYAVGQVFARHFESGGTFSNFNPANMRSVFEEEYEKGKRKAESWKKESGTSTSGDTLEKLRQLGDLKKSGVITEEEFQKMKAKLMEEM